MSCTERHDIKKSAIVENLSASRNNEFVNGHSYATKVPHEIVQQLIEYYTEEGDIVLDAFCGSGMSGIAAQMANRQIILNDLSPAATYISSNFNSNRDSKQFFADLENIKIALKSVEWLYQTYSHDKKIVPIIATLWSDILSCHECGNEMVYWDVALDYENSKIRDSFVCPECGVETSKNKSKIIFETFFDNVIGQTVSIGKRVPILIVYRQDGKTYEKKPDAFDLEIIDKANDYKIDRFVPIIKIPNGYNTNQPKKSHGLTYLHHFYTKRNLIALSIAWGQAKSTRAKFMLTSMMYKSSILCSPLMSNYFAAKKGQNRGGWIGKERSGTLYCPSIQSEVSLISQVKTRSKSANVNLTSNKSPFISTCSSTNLPIKNNSIDFIFIDPPFGANKMYSELNFMWEAWLQVRTDNKKRLLKIKYKVNLSLNMKS